MPTASDGFDRANSTTLTGDWSQTLSGGLGLGIDAGELYVSVAATSAARHTTIPDGPSMFAQVTWSVIESGVSVPAGPAVMIPPLGSTVAVTGTFYVMVVAGVSQTQVEIRRKNGNQTGQTTLGTAVVVSQVQPGSVLRLEFDGTDLVGSINGAEVIRRAASLAPLAETGVTRGVGFHTASSAGFGVTRWDIWSGGDVAVGGGGGGAAGGADAFNRPDADTLGLDWTQTLSTGAGMGVRNSRMANVTTFSQAARHTYVPAEVGMFSQVTWALIEPGVSVSAGPAVLLPPLGANAGATGSFYYLAVTGASQTLLAIRRKNANATITPLLGTTVTINPIVDGDVLRLEYDGTNLVGYLNGVEQIRRDPALQPLQETAVRGVGFFMAPGFGNVPTTHAWDTWSGGDISSTIVSDTFNRPNNVFPGGLWDYTVVGDSSLGIDNGRLYRPGTGTASHVMRHQTVPATASMFSQIGWDVVEAVSIAAGPAVMVPPVPDLTPALPGVADMGSYYSMAVTGVARDTLVVRRKDRLAVTNTRLGAAAILATPVAAGDVLRLEYLADTDTLVGYINGTEQIRRDAAPAPLQETEVRGVGFHSDNAPVATRWDNWSGGNLGDAGTVSRTATDTAGASESAEVQGGGSGGPESLRPNGTILLDPGWIVTGAATADEAIGQTTYGAANVATTTSAQRLTVTLSSLLGTPVGAPTVAVRAEYAAGSGSTVAVYQGTTSLATRTLVSSTSQQTFTLTASEYAAITNWADVRLRFVSGTGGLTVTHAYLDVPAAGADPTVARTGSDTGTAAETTIRTITGGGGATFADDFNRADAATLGSNWTASETGGVGPSVTVNRVRSLSTNQEVARYNTLPSGDLMFAQVQWAVTDETVGATTGPAVMMPPTAASNALNGSYYFFNATNTTHTNLAIRRKPAGVAGSSPLGTLVTISPGIAAGDVLRLEYDGTDLIGYLNGVERIRRAASLLPLQETGVTRGVGMLVDFNGPANRWDNWSGGDLGGGGGITEKAAADTATGADTAVQAGVPVIDASRTLIATAERGTNAASVTTGDGWDEVAAAVGTSYARFSNTRAAHGGLSYAIRADTSGGSYLGWTPTSLVGTFRQKVWGRLYVNRDTFTADVPLLEGRVTSSATQRFRIFVTSTGALRVTTAAGATATSTSTMATLAWYRVQWTYTGGPAGSLVVSLHNADTVAALDTVTITGDLGGGMDGVRFGGFTTATAVGTFYLDDLAVSTEAVQGVAPSHADRAAAAEAALIALSVADTGTTFDFGEPPVAVTALVSAGWGSPVHFQLTGTLFRTLSAGDLARGDDVASVAAGGTTVKGAADSARASDASGVSVITPVIIRADTAAAVDTGIRTVLTVTNISRADTAAAVDAGSRTIITTTVKTGADTATSTSAAAIDIGGSTGIERFRAGSWLEKPIPTTGATIHTLNARYLNELSGRYNGAETDGHCASEMRFAPGSVVQTTATNGPYVNTATTITVASSTGFPAVPFVVKVGSGSEWLSVTAVSGTTWTVKRGATGVAVQIATGATLAHGKAFCNLIGGNGGQDVTSFDMPVYSVSPTDTSYILVDNSGGTSVPTHFKTSPGLRLPEVAKQHFSGAVSSDSPLVVYDPARGYYATVAKAKWDTATSRWQVSVGGAAGVSYLGSYGIDSGGKNLTTVNTPTEWPATLPGSGVDPAVYQDEPGNMGLRGNHSGYRAVDFDRLGDEGILSYAIEGFCVRTHGSLVFPMTGFESGKGGAIPEGTRIHIKWSVDVRARLQATANAAGWTAQRLEEAVAIARGFQRHGIWWGDNSGTGSQVKLDAVHRKYPAASPPIGANNWAVGLDDLATFPFLDDWEFLAAGYDPPYGGTPPPPPPTASVPGAVPTAGVVAGSVTTTSVGINWTAATPATGFANQGYRVYRVGNATPVASTGAAARSATISGLAANTGYTFYVAAYNVNGEGDPSPNVAVTTAQDTTATVPGEPTSPSKTNITNTGVTITWGPASAPTAFPVTGYRVYRSGKAAYDAQVAATARQAAITGLTTNTSYVFSVVAFNANGEGPASADVPVTTTGAVTGVPFDQQRAGTWYKKKYPDTVPIHPSEATYLNDMNTGAGPFGIFRLVGAVGNTGSFATPAGFVTSATTTAQAPTYTIITNDAAMAPPLVAAEDLGGPGANVIPNRTMRIPVDFADSFSTNTGNAGSDRELLIVDKVAGYYVNLSKAWYWQPGQTIPGHGTAGQYGAWSCKGSQITYMSSYGFDYTMSGVTWPSTLNFYRDDPRNDGNHRGNPPPCRVIRWDEWTDGPLVAHKLEMYYWQTGAAGRFPMTGYESGKGGIVPEGTCMRIRPTVDLAAKLAWIKNTTAGQLGYDQAMMIAVCCRDYGWWVGDNSGGESSIKIEGLAKLNSTNRTNLWKVPQDAFKLFDAATDVRVIADNYDPP